MNRNVSVTVSRAIDKLLIVVIVAVITVEQVLVLAGDPHDLRHGLGELSQGGPGPVQARGEESLAGGPFAPCCRDN